MATNNPCMTTGYQRLLWATALLTVVLAVKVFLHPHWEQRERIVVESNGFFGEYEITSAQYICTSDARIKQFPNRGAGEIWVEGGECASIANVSRLAFG